MKKAAFNHVCVVHDCTLNEPVNCLFYVFYRRVCVYYLDWGTMDKWTVNTGGMPVPI